MWAAFDDLQAGDIIGVTYADGERVEFAVQEAWTYQAVDPYDPYSDFIGPDGEVIRASDLFWLMYGGDYPLVLQTCVERDGISAWGRLFVMCR
jgi:hypothetical protein